VHQVGHWLRLHGVGDDHKYVWSVCELHKYERSECHTSLTTFCPTLHIELLDLVKFIIRNLNTVLLRTFELHEKW